MPWYGMHQYIPREKPEFNRALGDMFWIEADNSDEADAIRKALLTEQELLSWKPLPPRANLLEVWVSARFRDFPCSLLPKNFYLISAEPRSSPLSASHALSNLFWSCKYIEQAGPKPCLFRIAEDVWPLPTLFDEPTSVELNVTWD